MIVAAEYSEVETVSVITDYVRFEFAVTDFVVTDSVATDGVITDIVSTSYADLWQLEFLCAEIKLDSVVL